MEDEKKQYTWHSSGEDISVLNTDACRPRCNKPIKSGIGGLLRLGGKGKFVCGFYGVVIASSITEAKMRALLQGLLMAKDKNVQKVICYADSKPIADIVYGKHSNHPNPRINAPLTTIRQILQLPWVVKIEHAVKEINEPTDKLAQKGYGLEKEEIVTFDHPVLELQHLLCKESSECQILHSVDSYVVTPTMAGTSIIWEDLLLLYLAAIFTLSVLYFPLLFYICQQKLRDVGFPIA